MSTSLFVGIAGAFLNPVDPIQGFEIGMAVGSLFEPQKSQTESLRDNKVSGSAYGTPMRYMYGHNQTQADIIWGVPLYQSSTAGGDKKLPGQPVYSTSVMLLVCASNPFLTTTSLGRIWADDLIIYSPNATATNYITPRVYDGDPSQTADPLIVSTDGFATAYRYRYTIMLESLSLLNFFNRVPNFRVELLGEPVSVADIITDLYCNQDGRLTTSDIDVTQVTGIMVRGFMMTGKSALKDTVDELLESYQIDQVEVDGVIRFVPRGGISSGLVPLADLGAGNWGGDSDNTRVKIERKAQDELPSSLSLRFLDVVQNYQANSVRETYPLTPTVNDVQINSPLVLTTAEAWVMVRQRLYMAWGGISSLEWVLPWKYLADAPADIRTLPMQDGSTARVRITGTPYATIENWIKFSGISDDPSALIQFAPIAQAGIVNTPQLQVPQHLPWDAWSGQEINDADTTAPGFYAVVGGLVNGQGASVYYSTDGFSSAPIFAGTMSANGTFGATTSTLPDPPGGWSPDTWDHVSTVDVLLSAGSLVSTAEASAPPNNGALVGQEYLYFANQTLNASMAYTLDDFLRGQRNSVVTGHTTGDRFVLNNGSVARFAVPLGLVGTTIDVSVVPDGVAIADITPVSVTISAPSPIPLGAPTAPDSVGIGDPQYSGVTETIVFSPIFAAPPVAPQGYNWQSATSADNITWSSWSATSNLPGSFTSPGFTSGYVKARVQGATPDGRVSAWVESSAVQYKDSVAGLTPYYENFPGPASTATLAHTPVVIDRVTRNGQENFAGSGTLQYSIAGAVITPVTPLADVYDILGVAYYA